MSNTAQLVEASSSNEKVKYAKLHQNVFIKGAGDLGSTLDTAITSKTGGIKMETTEHGLHITYKGHRALVPYANISVLVFA